jgi:hypothetical protein
MISETDIKSNVIDEEGKELLLKMEEMSNEIAVQNQKIEGLNL